MNERFQRALPTVARAGEKKNAIGGVLGFENRLARGDAAAVGPKHREPTRDLGIARLKEPRGDERFVVGIGHQRKECDGCAALVDGRP